MPKILQCDVSVYCEFMQAKQSICHSVFSVVS